MIDADFVAKIVENAQPRILMVGDRSYSTALLQNLPLPTEPEYPGIALYSLDSFVDAVKSMTDGFVKCAPLEVAFCTEPKGEHRKREIRVKALPNVNGPKLGEYESLENMRLSLLTGFVDTPSRQECLIFLSQVTDQSVMTSADDGVSQTVTAKTGIASYGKAAVPSPVTLQPIRTFAEVEQPEGKFVMRLKQQEKGLPLAGLFELHTNWQRQAALNVKAYLDGKNLLAVPIYA